jgi:hypothetical protein
MGSRASYVVKKEGESRAYGSHWGATSLTDHLFWGPESATEVFESQGELDELAEIEGGDEGYALVDWDEKRLIWYAANCELPVQQRLYNRMLAEMWPGWKIGVATHGYDDLFDHLGITQEQADDEEDEEYEEEYAEDEDERFDLEENMVFEPKPVGGPIEDLEELEPGNWLTVRDEDGSYRDFFGFQYDIDDCLCQGNNLLDYLEKYAALDAPPRELVTCGGAIIDRKDRVIRRWEGPRYEWHEKQLREAWDGWRLEDLAGQWEGQLQATGRDMPHLAGEDRLILGVTVADLLTDSSIDPRQMLSNIATLARGMRFGCAGITVAVALLGGALAAWLSSTTATVIVAVIFVVCLFLTVRLWQKTSGMLGILDMTDGFAKDKPLPKGHTVEEKRDILDGILSRLGYPSIGELEDSGELSSREEYDEDEDEEEE